METNYRELGFSGITIQQMQIFIEAAELENISLAAEKLNIAQATASRNIASLEYALHISLFQRSQRRIHLTAAGIQLAEDFRRILKTLSNNVTQAQAIQNKSLEHIQIGDYDSTRCDSYLLSIVDKFNTRIGREHLIIERKDPVSLFEGLREHYYDGVFYSVLGKEKLRSEGFEFKQVIKLCPYITFSKRHRLYKKEELSVADFCGESIAIMAKHYKFYWQFIEQLCDDNNLEPKEFIVVENPQSMVFEVMAGKSIAIVDNAHVLLENAGIRSIRLQDKPTMGYGLAYSKDNNNPLFAKFLSCL